MNTEWKGNDLIITITNAKTAPGTPSKSGKMALVASTHGFARVPDSDLKLSLNAEIDADIAALQQRRRAVEQENQGSFLCGCIEPLDTNIAPGREPIVTIVVDGDCIEGRTASGKCGFRFPKNRHGWRIRWSETGE